MNIAVTQYWPHRVLTYINRNLLNYNFGNVEQVLLGVTDIWKNIGSETIKRLRDSMPDIILSFQKFRDGNIK